jgi:phage-related minor tail protein
MKIFVLLLVSIIFVTSIFGIDYEVTSITGTVEFDQGQGFLPLEVGHYINEKTELKLGVKSILELKSSEGVDVKIRSSREEKLDTLAALLPRAGGAGTEAEGGKKTRNTKIITGSTAKGNSASSDFELADEE